MRSSQEAKVEPAGVPRPASVIRATRASSGRRRSGGGDGRVSFVDLAQRIVLGTSHWPGLREAYHGAYELGLSFTASRLRSVPGVLAVMLRAGDDGRTWCPGLSDYDLTVLTRSSDPTDMLRFLDRLWRRYRSVKTTVPQLGEMEVMSLADYEDHLRFGPMPTAALKRAYPLFVEADTPDVDRVLQREPRPARAEEITADALARYVRFAFPAWLRYASGDTSVARRRAEHLLDNVGKRLRRLGVSADTTTSGTIAGRMLRIFRELSRACGRLPAGGGEAGAVMASDASVVTGPATALLATLCSEALRQARTSDCAVVVWTSYMTGCRPSLVFVVPDDVAENELETLLRSLGAVQRALASAWTSASDPPEVQLFFPALACPVVLSRSMWTCWRELFPFEGAAIAATARTIAGPAEEHAVPSIAALRRGAEAQYAALLPLKNNWRPLGGPGSPRVYAAMVNHVQGYASATSGTVRTMPSAYDFTSVREGYVAVSEELSVLRARLTS